MGPFLRCGDPLCTRIAAFEAYNLPGHETGERDDRQRGSRQAY